jgi:beta propeller repeat protein
MGNKLKVYSTGLAAISLVLFLILVSSAATAAPLTITETRITTSGSASNPDIYKDKIVWQDTRYSGNDIYMYDVSAKNLSEKSVMHTEKS